MLPYDSNLNRRRFLRNTALVGVGAALAAGGLYWAGFFRARISAGMINFTAPSSYDLDPLVG
jgi:hypothetical protein